jgi:replicative DNA helicase
MTNFKDSISIAQTANTVIMLWRDKKEWDESKQYETEFICPKNRIDEPSFTVKAIFDNYTNDYKWVIDSWAWTKNSEYQNVDIPANSFDLAF